MKSFLSALPASLTICVLLLLALFSCKKDPYELGFDLLPPSDTLNVLMTDTCTVEAYSVIQDSVRTDESSTVIMGSMLDPIYGKITAGFYSQVRLGIDAPDFGINPVLDSLVLILYYAGYYGDTTSLQSVKVYEISQDLIFDSSYWSNQRVATYSSLIGTQTFYPHPNDSVKVSGKMMAAHVRINLNKFSNYLGNKILYAPSDVLADNAAFINFFKGLHIESNPVNSGGALLNFSAGTSTTCMEIYFHNAESDSLSYQFLVDDKAARFTTIDHNDYLDASPDLKRQILNHDTAQGANQLFLEGLGGVKLKLRFPYMKDFGKNHLIAVNDALLMFSNKETDTTYAPPPSLTLLRQDSIGRVSFLADENEGQGYFGGIYNRSERSYYFRITQHIQKVIQHSYTNSFDLYILVNNPTTRDMPPYRVMLEGTKPTIPGSLANRFRLKLVYTRLL
ncbi:MAG: DUF4270 domain-containing protein [bacterium]